MQALLDELARDLAPLTGLADLEQAVGLVEAATTSLAKATSWLLDASPDDVLAASAPELDLASLAVTGALLDRAVRRAEQHASPRVAYVPADRFGFYAGDRVRAAPPDTEAHPARDPGRWHHPIDVAPPSIG